MAVTSGFFNSVNGDRKYNADQMSEFFRGIVTEGVFQNLDGGLAVSAGSGMSVNVATGRAIINWKWVENDDILALTIPAASSTYGRIDAVVLNYNETYRRVTIIVKAGTASASPTAPSMTRAGGVYQMALAYVNVPANATSVTVTDKRADSTVCGWAAVAQSADGEIIAMLNAMKTGFDGVTYPSPVEMVQGCDEKLQGEIDLVKSGEINKNALDLSRIKNVSGVFTYLYGILHGKTIATVSGTYKIIDSPTDDVYLFEQGFGWVSNTSSVRLLVLDKTTLEVVEHKSASGAYNLNTVINSSRLLAVVKSGIDTLDFDYSNDSKIKNHVKDMTAIPKTLFGTSSWSAGVNAYNGTYKAFAPFKYNGTVTVKKYNGHAIYNVDGTIYSYAGGSTTQAVKTIDVPNKVVVVFSNDITNASIEFGNIDYQYSGKTCSVFGDSLTADAPYYPYLANLTGLVIKNCGIGGTRVSGSGDTAMWQNVRVNTLEGDFIVIMGGTNDCPYADAGTESMDNVDTDTFIGAYNVMLSKIYYRYKQSTGYYQSVDYTGVTQLTDAQFPNIILVTPPKRFDSDNNYNKSGEFGEYVKKIASWWGLPVVDSWNNMQMSWANMGWFFDNSETLHYNTHGRSKLGSLIADKFAECYANFNDQV